MNDDMKKIEKNQSKIQKIIFIINNGYIPTSKYVFSFKKFKEKNEAEFQYDYLKE
jgi:hypothetical protein